MPRPPYHLARQEHVGDALDDLQSRGLLRWRWDYDTERSRALFRICEVGSRWNVFHTADAERIAQAWYEELGEPWKPVPHPGGERHRAATLNWIAQQRMLGRSPRRRSELKGDLTVAQAAALLGVRASDIERLAADRQLLAVESDSGSLLVPAWQIDSVRRDLVYGLSELLVAVDAASGDLLAAWGGGSCEELCGMTPGQVLATYGDVELVLSAWANASE